MIARSPISLWAIARHVLLIAGAVIMLLPFISGVGEKSPQRRPMAVLIVVVVFLVLGELAWLGTYAPWSPRMEAWSASPVPIQYIRGRSPVERRGAALVQGKQCRNCHALDGDGGLRGPAARDLEEGRDRRLEISNQRGPDHLRLAAAVARGKGVGRRLDLHAK